MLRCPPKIIPPNHANPSSGDRLVGRRIRIGVKVHGDGIVEQLLPPDANIVFGGGGAGVLTVRGWTAVAGWYWAPGMSVIMCHESGEDRMEGTFEELTQAGVSFPLHINVSRLNIRVRAGVVMLMDYMRTS
jgi:hypothetical protein